MNELVRYLKALVYLQVQHLPEEGGGVKPEVLLANAGLSYSEIAEALGKSEAAVAKSVSRARGSHKKGKKDD